MRPRPPRAGDKCKIMRPKAFRMATKCGRQVGDKCKILRPRAPKMEDKRGRQVGDKWETNVKSRSPEHPEWETSVGDKSKITRPRPPRAKNKWETSVKSCDPGHPEREKIRGRQYSKCKIMAQTTQNGKQVTGRQV